jgi:ParB family transcriptional regulator, chromosome partitioning protein
MADRILVRAGARGIPPAEVRPIPIALIDPPAFNPRRDFDKAELDHLAESIAQPGIGLLQPVIVRPKGERFELVAGERRFRALKRLKRTTVDATVRDLDDRHAAEIRLLENLDRKNLNPIEEAVAFQMLERLGHTATSLAKLVRAQERIIEARLSLLQLPEEWQAWVQNGQISVAQGEYLVAWAR